MAYRDAAGFMPEEEKSPFTYSPGNLQMMKEYGMTEEEFAYEFGGRPHQQRQSPVARSDLERLRIPMGNWDYCSHKFIPMWFCLNTQISLLYAGSGGAQCAHFVHEFELCNAAEFIRQNQVLQRKRRIHLSYNDADKNWLYNDPNYGHMFFRSKYGADSFKGKFMMGSGTRCIDPPTHELSMENNPKYNPEIVRSDLHPHYAHLNSATRFFNNTFKYWWNKSVTNAAPTFSSHKTICPDQVAVFDPLVDGAQMKPW
eukprot:TRINITY_DN8848_c0_g1_i1.p1 TRINITY_DN8848_c0_g1~~TRINITY_DN8848_c0_g1_i1.p1  ORF type:complete len:269 (+),score=60.06 TRINITY_DN8848_c0_g1_i1:42-809(+)